MDLWLINSTMLAHLLAMGGLLALWAGYEVFDYCRYWYWVVPSERTEQVVLLVEPQATKAAARPDVPGAETHETFTEIVANEARANGESTAERPPSWTGEPS